MQVNLPDTMTIPVRKTGGEYVVQLVKLNPDMILNVLTYGVRQISNDCHSAVPVDPEKMTDAQLLTAHAEVEALIAKRWDAIYSGEWRVRTGAGEPVDPVTREAMRLARESVVAVVRAAGKKWKDYSDEQKEAATEKAFKANEQMFMDRAKKALADRKAAAGTVGALADLGL